MMQMRPSITQSPAQLLQVANAQAAGAVAAMVYDNQINDYFLMLADGDSASSTTIPGMAVPRRVGQLLVSATQVCN